MARGLPRRVYVGQSGLESVYGQYTPNIMTKIYSTSLTKDDEFDVGDSIVLPDGREFIYSKSDGTAAMYNAHGCEFTYTGYTAYTAFGVSAAVGDTEVTVPAATHAALTQDELKGGYIIIFDGASDYYTATRGIIGNDAASANAAFVVYLDGPLTYAVTAATSACETYQNPYAALRTGQDRDKPKAGVPATYVAADTYYFWVQKAGIVWAAPQANLGNTGGKISGWWHDVGNISDCATSLGVTIPAAKSSQYAGYVVEGSISGNGPLFMLKG